MWNPFKRSELDFGLVENLEHENDPRNVLYSDLAPLGGEQTLPLTFSLGDVVSYNQGHTSACTCHAAVHALLSTTGTACSPRHTFWKIKTDPRFPSSRLAWGAYMKDAIQAVIEGVSLYALAPNEHTESDSAYLMLRESEQMKASAESTKGGNYMYLSQGNPSQEERFATICRYLYAEKKPVIIGMDWWTSFNNARKTGIIPMEKPSGKIFGHAVLATGWTTIKGTLHLIVENSFGDTWGDHGKTYLPLGYAKVTSAIGFVPRQNLVIPPKVEVPRDIFKEKAVAQELRTVIYEKFPLDVLPSQLEANTLARSLAGRMWLTLVPAVTYRGWTVTDVINYLYAQSRKKTKEKAYSLDFTHVK